MDNNSYAFISYIGNFLCAEECGGGEVNCDRKFAKEWETFTLFEM